MNKAVGFYEGVLGFKLAARYGDHWAQVEAGPRLTIGLHPKSPNHPTPGTAGAMMIGIECTDSIDKEVKRLEGLGVRFNRKAEGEGGRFTYFSDPDGNPLYLRASGR